jgi:hypothetical protein
MFAPGDDVERAGPRLTHKRSTYLILHRIDCVLGGGCIGICIPKIRHAFSLGGKVDLVC